MTPEKQRIAIAEVCGWKYVNTNKHTWIDPHGQGEPFHKGAPDYLNDLNSMHEAEKELIGRNNWELCGYVHKLHFATNGWPAFASAAQRAEAFLREINKWEPNN